LSDVNANIGINFDTSNALAQLRQLQAGLSRFNQSLTQGNVAAMNAQKALNSQLMQAINATGKFVATQKDVATSTSSFTQALEKNQLSMRQYFRYTAAAATQNTKVFKGMFAQERETLTRASKDRVKLLQAQYIQMQAANGDMIKTLQVIPKHLKMVNGQYTDYATRMQMAAQRQQFLNKLLSQGSTQLLNFGKNTQWAGRQLMVGLTIPLTILGSTAAKTFMEMEQAVIKFTRVYGDMLTDGSATDKAIADIQRLGKEYTKYGIAVKDTVEMAASAAAMGLTGDALNAQVINATRLAVLGQVEQAQALETTISLTNAFGLASDQLAAKINYLNAVENQTVLSIEDLTIAIPKAGPVVKQLGGSVEDLAFFMTAMKEGGINASEGANALKSGLASMINPSKKAAEFLNNLGINIKGIVEANAGDLKGTVVGFARALDTLDPLNRARAIEQMFGKFQFARLSTLFQNVTSDASQASRALGLAGASVEELAILSERELKKVEDATGTKFKKSMEDLKNQLIPIGKAFLQAATPIVEFVGKVLAKFNNLSEGTKKVIAIIVGVVGGLAPIALMTFGILMNGVANTIKLFAKLRGGVAQLNGSNNVLGGGFEYLTNQQIENLAQSNALHTSHSQLISTFNVEAASVQALAAAYGNAASQARALAQSSPGLFNTVPGPAGAVSGLPPKKFAQGGVVPGTGNKDTVPALLTPGEVVITKKTVKENPELVAALQNGSVKRYNDGTGRIVTADQQTFISQMRGRSSDPAAVADEIGKQFEFINNTTAEKLVAYARSTGRVVTDTSEEALEQLRASLVTNVKRVIEAAADAAEERGRQLTATAAANAPKKVGTAGPDASLHQFYNPRAKQQESQQFSHVETSTSMPIDQLSRTIVVTNEKTQSELLNLQRAIQTYNETHGTNVEMPTATPVSGFGYELQGQVNKAMNDESPEITNFKGQGRTVATIDAFLESFEETGVEKWKKAIEIGGGNFEQLSGALRVYDDRLLQAVRQWKQDNPGQAFTDTVFKGIEQKVRSEVAGLDTELGQVFEVARQTVTAVRVSMTAEQKAIANADAIARGETNSKGEAYTEAKPKYSKSRSTFQAGGTERRVEGGAGNFIEVDEAALADARAEGAALGQAVIDGSNSAEGADNNSPSKKGKKVGKDIADGIVLGMEEAKAAVKSQAASLAASAVPERRRTAAETQARIDKMDLVNKGFYDELDTPELRDERQVYKSVDRQRRKNRKGGITGSSSLTPPVSGTASLTVDSTARTEAAAEQLAVSTEQAATAQSQVVQQIKDESKTRVKIKGNTINIGQAREEADKAESEAATARKKAAALEAEQAKQIKSKSPTTITDAQVLESKEKANALELEAAKKRQAAAMAELEGKDIVVTDEDVKTPGKVQKIKDDAQEEIANGTQEQGDGLRRIVEGTDETADSTLSVADQTDELANVTGEAVDAQTQTAGNLVTGAQITDATTGNMNDVLQSTGQTGVAQDDIAGSSENIADINRDIEEDKRKIRELGQQELAARMKDAGAIIPEGSQSANQVFDPNKAPSYTEAYDEVMGRAPGTNGPDDPGQTGYTRNKKGQFLFDPETGEPTTLTESQLKKKKRGMRREKVGKFSGKVSGGLGTAAMVAGMAGAPPQVTAALGTAATVAQFAPMIAGMGPIGIAVTAIAALGAGAFLLNKHFNKMAAAAAKFATDLSATRDGLKSIGEMSGKVGASQIMDKRRQTSQYGKYDEEIKIDNTFGEKFLGSDVGKKEKKLFQENVKKFGNDKAVKDLSLKLATAVADGVLDAGAANSIAAELALQLKDQKLEMQLVGQLSTIIGPDGKNLKDKPLETRALILANANNRVIDAEADIASGTGNRRENIASVAAYNMNNIEMATMMADQVQLEYETQKKKLEAELASTSNAQKKLEIGQQIADLDAQNVRNSQIMNSQLLTQIALQQKSFEKVYSASKFSGKEDAYFDASRSQLEINYKGTDQEEAAKKFLNTSEDFADNKLTNGLRDNKTAQTFQAKMEMLVGSRVLSPSEANNYIDLFSGQLDKFDVLFDASVQIHGTPKTKELLNMFTGYTDKKKATEIVTQIALTKTDPAQFDAIMEALKGIQALDGVTIDMEVLLTSLGLEGLEVVKGQMEEIEKIKEAAAKKGDKKMDLGAVANLGPTQKALVKELELNEERMGEFNKLNLEQQAEYLQKLQAQFAYESMLTETEKVLQAEKFARQQAMMQQAAGLIAIGTAAFDAAVEGFKADYLAMSPEEAAVAKLKPVYATSVTSLGATDVPAAADGGKKDDPLDFLDSLAMRIKMVRDQSFNAKKPIESMLAAFNSPAAKKNVANMFKLFDGVQQKLIALKVPAEFRDYIAGLDAEQFDELRKADLDKKKKGQQGIFTYAAKKDKDGKTLKDKKGNVVYDTSRIVGISKEGKAIMAAYNEAPLDKFNIAQRAIITDADNQFKAFNKLKAAGIDTATALEIVADEALAGALASKQYSSKEIEAFAKDVKNSADALEKAAVMADLLKKNADFEFKANAVPKLAAALKETGMSVENIQTVLQDPALAKQLVKDLEDGKIDSKAIADYLNSIKDEKIVEIRGKFNAGDFAGAAAPGMELVNKMFSVQEQLIRTGVDARSTAMVARLKSLKTANEKLQIDIQKITFDFIRPLEKAIEKAQRDIEINITRKIEDYQEQMNDLQRVIEIAFERPIAAINAENTILSNDMEIMNKAAEEINKRYDEQAEALSKVAEINAQIVEQEKEQLDLADALSKGDIAAAARAVQSIRASQAARNAENASKALEQSRKNEVDSLRGRDSGLSQEQITERQYVNAQAIYDLENRATTEVNGKLLTRLQILDEIQKKSDEIYNLEEKREAAQLLIRNNEDKIYDIREKQIKPLEEQLEINNMQIALDEYNLERLVSGITVLGKTKDTWDGIAAKIEASSLAGQDFDRLMGSMLASTDQIEKGWANIESTLAKYSSATAAAEGSAMDAMRDRLNEELALNERNAKAEADKAKAAQLAAEQKYATEKAAYDAELAQIEKLKSMGLPSFIVDSMRAALKAPVKPSFGPSTAADDPNVSYNDPTKNAATDIYNSAIVKGPTTSNAGGGSGSSANVPGPGGNSGGGGGGGGGTSGNTDPGKTDPNAKADTGLSDRLAAIKSLAAPTSTFKGVAYSTTYDGLKEDRTKVATTLYKMKESFIRDFPDAKYILDQINYASSRDFFASQALAALGRVPENDKQKAEVRIKALIAQKDAYDKYTYKTDRSGKKNPAVGGRVTESDAAANAAAEARKQIPKDLLDVLQILQEVNSSIASDAKQVSSAKSAYIEARKAKGYNESQYPLDSWDIEKIKSSNKPAYDLMLPAYTKYQEAKKAMTEKSALGAKARSLVLKAGYSAKDFDFYFGDGTNLLNKFENKKDDYVNWKGYATGGLVSSKFAQKRFNMGTDTVPAMLTPGEFVMNKFAVQTHGIGKMQAMNSGSSVGDSVYNYSISVNVKSESNPDEIARTVMAQIKSVDAQKIRGVRS
jgi:hypothetical protein